MAIGELRVFLRQVRRLAETPLLESRSDPQLLQRFVENKDEAAFAMIVQRHGPMASYRGLSRRAQSTIRPSSSPTTLARLS